MKRAARRLLESRHWVFDILPSVLPASYRKIEEVADGSKYIRDDGMTVITSGAVEEDGRRWLHVSCAHPRRLPSWSDLLDVKQVFVGRDRTAIQVIPPKAKHVNIHPNCLHLFCCVDDDVLPDFTQGTGSL